MSPLSLAELIAKAHENLESVGLGATSGVDAANRRVLVAQVYATLALQRSVERIVEHLHDTTRKQQY